MQGSETASVGNAWYGVQTERTYSIGHVARRLCVTPQVLRYYEAKGLILTRRSVGQTRRFSSTDICRLERIQGLLQSGVNVTGIQRLLAMIPCWKVMGCGEQRCPQTEVDALPCWAARCGKCWESEEHCIECPVYAEALDVLGSRVVLELPGSEAQH